MSLKKSGYDAPNEFIRLHGLVSGLPPIKMTPKGKQHMQTRFKRLKDTWNLTQDNLKELFVFMYAMNPLGFEDLSEYGALVHLDGVAAEFVKWRKANRVAVETFGIRKAIYRSIEDKQDMDPLLAEALDELGK